MRSMTFVALPLILVEHFVIALLPHLKHASEELLRNCKKRPNVAHELSSGPVCA
jgi:hypothetical protein